VGGASDFYTVFSSSGNSSAQVAIPNGRGEMASRRAKERDYTRFRVKRCAVAGVLPKVSQESGAAECLGLGGCFDQAVGLAHAMGVGCGMARGYQARRKRQGVLIKNQACSGGSRQVGLKMTIRKAQPAVLIVTGIAMASPSPAATLKVGANQAYRAPSAAAAAAKNGNHIEIDPGEYFDCAVWNADNLVIEGTGPGVIITDKTCMGKGLFVIEGKNTTVRNLTLTRARVPDMNGAGIRLDNGDLTVDNVRFIDNQNGIMGGVPGTTVTIRNSDFEKNGTCEAACAHGIYIENIDLLRIENSHFSNTRQGHSIKSRALRTEVIGSTITDGPEGTSSYLIEAPNGGTLVVSDNTLEKGPKSENHNAAIAIGAEGVTHPTAEITITNNDFRNNGNYQTALLWNLTVTPATLNGNKLSGSVSPLKEDGRFTGFLRWIKGEVSVFKSLARRVYAKLM
jgi:Right handed beta helix region